MLLDLKQENAALKQALSKEQLKILRLDFENKVLTKERDEFENLLTDAESKIFDAEQLRTNLRNLLPRSFASIKDVKNCIREILSENDCGFEKKKIKLNFKP